MEKAEQYYKLAAEAGKPDGQFCYGMQFFIRENNNPRPAEEDLNIQIHS